MNDESGRRDEGRGENEASLSLDEVASLTGGRVEGPSEVRIRAVAPVHDAGSDDLALLADRKYLRHLEERSPGALLVSEELASEVGGAARVVVDDPHRALVPLLERLHPEPHPRPGVHPTAVLGRDVRLGADVTIGPYAVLEAGSVVGDRVRIGAHTVVGEGCRIGTDAVLHPHVVLYPGTILGERVILHAGARLGVDGFGYVFTDEAHRKVPQVGTCVVGDDVEIGANTTVDRGSIGRTEVGEGSKIDNLVQIGHNVRLGPLCVLAAQTGVAGSTRIGRGVLCGGQVGIGGHLEVGDGARLAGQAGVIGDVPPGETYSSYPARPHADAMRANALTLKLPELLRRIRELERRLGGEDGQGGSGKD